MIEPESLPGKFRPLDEERESRAAVLQASLDDTILRLADARRKIASLERRIAEEDAGSAAIRLKAAVRYPLSMRKRREYRRSRAMSPDAAPAPDARRSRPAELVPLPIFVRDGGPTVSAIVPNYNHARFLEERLSSIAKQTVPVHEIIVLDDASTDHSRDVIERFRTQTRIPLTVVLNETNSGNVFRQWARGIALAEGDLLWICESDDTCDRNFVRALVPYFRDPSVMMAFGMIDHIDQDGDPSAYLAGYMESAAPGYWQEPRLESAYTWFNGPFGRRNVIPNAGGCMFRRQQIDEELLAELVSYTVCGDWLLYSVVGRGGRIAYDPAARAFFRQHTSNTSRLNFKTEAYLDEHIRIAHALRRHYGTGAETLGRFREHVLDFCRSELGRAAARRYADQHPIAEFLGPDRAVPHILIAIKALDQPEDGVPLRLARALVAQKWDVSLLLGSAEGVTRAALRGVPPEIALFTRGFVENTGVQVFLDEYGVSLVHGQEGALGDWLRSAGVRTPVVATTGGVGTENAEDPVAAAVMACREALAAEGWRGLPAGPANAGSDPGGAP